MPPRARQNPRADAIWAPVHEESVPKALLTGALLPLGAPLRSSPLLRPCPAAPLPRPAPVVHRWVSRSQAAAKRQPSGPRLNVGMAVRITFARVCRDSRIRLDVTQRELADAVGLSRGYISKIESGIANPTVEQIDQIGRVLGLDLTLMATPPIFPGERRAHDLVHARCSGYSGRRLIGLRWSVAREVEVFEGRMRGWIDLLAFDPNTRTLLVIEIKTRLDDLGGIERQLSRYERLAGRAAGRFGWKPERISSWLVMLASDEVDVALHANRDVIDQVFPGRAAQMTEVLSGGAVPVRSLAMVDPSSRRSGWLIRTRLDARRAQAPYTDYADAARRLAR